MRLYPVGLRLEGRPVLVVGGGTVAARKVEGLLECGARVHVVAPEIVDDIRSSAATFEERPYRPGDVAGFRLVVTATDDPAVNAAVSADAESSGVWVNAADDPANCSFTLPAVLRRGDVTVAVATGGASPALSAWLRDRIAADVGPEYAMLAEMLAEARAENPDRDWRKLLDSGILEDIKAGRIAEARERLQSW